MARKSKVQHTPLPPKTRQAQIMEEEDEEVNEGALEPSSDFNQDVDPADDGKILHLGSELPDAPVESGEGQTPEVEDEVVERQQSRAPVADMGANNSREEINAALHATAAELNKSTKAATTVEKRSTGKLKRPSASATHPAYRNPVSATVSFQRKLAPSSRIRASTYDLDGESPVKLSPAKSSLTAQASGFVPRRSERKAAQQANGQLENEAAVVASAALRQITSSPRRSRKIQEAEEQDGQDVIFKDYFNDSTVRRHQNTEAGAEAETGVETEVGVENNDFSVTQPHEDGQQRDEQSGPRKIDIRDEEPEHHSRPRGRPKKSVEEKPKPVEEKRKPGRPRKSGDEVTQTNHSLRNRDDRSTLRKDEAVSRDAVRNLPGRQTRAQEAASESPRKSQANPTQRSIDQQTQPNVQPHAAKETEEQSAPGVEVDTGAAVSEDGSFAPQDDDEGLPEQSLPARDADIVRRIEMNFTNGGGESDVENGSDGEDEAEDEAEDDEEDEQQNPGTRGQKRKAPSQTHASSSRSKRNRFQDAELQAREEPTEAENEVDNQRVYGQWPRLRQVFEALDKVGRPTVRGVPRPKKKIALKNNDVKAVIALCAKAEECFTALKDRPENAENVRDPASILVEIDRRVDGLRGNNKDLPTNFKDKTKCTNIYFHLIPRLVGLLRHAILCYETLDKDEASDGQITMGHLRIVNNMIILVLGLETSAVDKYTGRPNSKIRVVKPVHNDVAAPLRSIRDALSRHIYKHELATMEKQWREQEARDRAHRLEQEERQSRQQVRMRQLRDKWNQLHDERMLAEGGIMSQKKRVYLQLPDQIDVDENGTLFERAEVFHSRVGPPPGLVDIAATQQWSMVELRALCAGLQRYTGPNVFERIFRKYCQQGQELNKYNVTEIVTTAAGLRKNLIENQRGQYGDVEGWITAIPVWTNAHQALGKENEDGVVVDRMA